MPATRSPGTRPHLLLAAHGTRSPAGAATTAAIATGVATARPDLQVSLCYVDVLEPSLSTALDDLPGPVAVVPLLLSTGYHVQTDIPAVVAGRPDIQVARHLGPQPGLAQVLATRLAEARGDIRPASTALVAIGSSRPEARDDVAVMAGLLGELIRRPVAVVPLFGDVRAALAELPAPVEVATYLLAEGIFWDGLLEAVGGQGYVAAPIGVAPELVELVLARYAEITATPVR